MKRADDVRGVEGAGQPVVLQGTLDVMILSVLSQGEAHGYGIAREIERRSGGVLAIEEGSLYPALHRLTKRGDLSAAWRLSETGRRARFYTLTSGGRKQLAYQRSLWEKLSGAVGRVIGEGGVVTGLQGA
jgi:PadR family transcriptional regulator PadR